jgi:methionyl-tRNA synthetase
LTPHPAASFFLFREVPFGNDGDFSHKAVVGRMNADLANDYGNLVQRVLSMIARNCGERVPEPGELTADDEALLTSARGLLDRVREAMEVQALHRALELVFEVTGRANRYVDAQAPWVLRKSDPVRMATVLWVLAETIRHLAILTQPFMPGASGRILDLLAIPAEQRDFAALAGRRLEPGTALPKPEGVFPRYAVEPA